MTELAHTYQTATPIILFHPPTLPAGIDAEAVTVSLAAYYDGRRDGLLRELAAVEKEMGLGTEDKPTTAQIRAAWRGRVRECPRCELEL